MHIWLYKYAFLNVDDCKWVITKVMYMYIYIYNLLFPVLSMFVLLGTVDLHNLPLKKTALKGLELPLEVKSGFIGHLQLSIPLRRPKSEPWIVHITKLYLVAGPLQHSEVVKLCDKQHLFLLSVFVCNFSVVATRITLLGCCCLSSIIIEQQLLMFEVEKMHTRVFNLCCR